jgi:hypothetical protein
LRANILSAQKPGVEQEHRQPVAKPHIAFLVDKAPTSSDEMALLGSRL